jgi:iron complex transport system substrate-binding protein
MNLSRRSTLLALGASATAGLLSACSTGPSSGGSSASSPQGPASGQFPVTIKHAFGQTVITSQPRRVATVSWVNADVVLALGVVPVGMAEDSFGQNANKSLPWKDAALERLGAAMGTDKAPAQYSETDGLNFAAIAKTTPDIIIGAYSGMTKEDYAKLSKIAPTIAYPDTAWGTSWQDSLTIIGKSLGKTAEAEKLLQEKTALLAKVAADHPEFRGKTFIFGNLTPGKADGIAAYTSSDNRARFMEQIGFTLAPVVVAAEKKNAQSFSVDFSAENASTLTSDILLTWVADATAADAVKKDQLLSQIPAVKNNAAVFDSNNTNTIALSAFSVLSVDYALEKYVPMIAEAVKNVK